VSLFDGAHGEFNIYSGKASDVARQLAFAGLGFIWLFKPDGADIKAVPHQLHAAAVVLIAGLALDAIHYLAGSLIWGGYALHYRAKAEDAMGEAPMWPFWTLNCLFLAKTLAVAVGYVILLLYVKAVLYPASA